MDRRSSRAIPAAAALWAAVLGAGAQPARAPEHECHLFGYAFDSGGGSPAWLSTLCAGLYEQTLPDRSSRDGWGFGYFLAPPVSWIVRPILVRSGAPASEDLRRWCAAEEEIIGHGLAGSGVILGHVRNSSSGPDGGALPDPHPFADSLDGRWWIFAHNGAAPVDTLRSWLDAGFLARHPLDYAPLYIDSELFFRYCLQEIAAAAGVRAGLCAALHRMAAKSYVFNLCLTDGDTLWAAHSFVQVPFYYGPAGGARSWWASLIPAEDPASAMEEDRLYWFASQGMGSVSYE
jgi:predicted glutamine amidotransferase